MNEPNGLICSAQLTFQVSGKAMGVKTNLSPLAEQQLARISYNLLACRVVVVAVVAVHQSS